MWKSGRKQKSKPLVKRRFMRATCKTSFHETARKNKSLTSCSSTIARNKIRDILPRIHHKLLTLRLENKRPFHVRKSSTLSPLAPTFHKTQSFYSTAVPIDISEGFHSFAMIDSDISMRCRSQHSCHLKTKRYAKH